MNFDLLERVVEQALAIYADENSRDSPASMIAYGSSVYMASVLDDTLYARVTDITFETQYQVEAFYNSSPGGRRKPSQPRMRVVVAERPEDEIDAANDIVARAFFGSETPTIYAVNGMTLYYDE
jgi:hypothetical protein